jgi:hypothetical protein
MCIHNAKFVDREARRTFLTNIMAENALSSATLVPTNVMPNLAALMISPYTASELGKASIRGTCAQLDASLQQHALRPRLPIGLQDLCKILRNNKQIF